MRWLKLSRLLAGLLLASPVVAEPVPHDWLEAEVPVRMANAEIPAAILAVVHGDQIRVLAYGVEADAVFRVGSLSKPVTASLILKLTDLGLLELHEDVRDDFTLLPIAPPLDRPLTLHHLLTHTAGFNERLFGQHVRSPDGFLPLHDYLRQHLPPRFIQPGQIIAYNDHHTALAGWLAERTTGIPFAELARQYLFAPLEMVDSTFEQVDIPAAMAPRLARSSQGLQAPNYDRDYIQLTPAAGLYTTAGDMARYMRALLGGTLAGSEAQLKIQFRHHPRLPGRGYGFAEGQHGDLQYFYKDGQATGFNARLLLVPEHQFGLFVAHNRTIFGPLGAINAAGRFNRALGTAVLERLWPVQATAEGSTDTSDLPLHDIDLSAYAGTYRTVVAARHTWERIISLFDEAVVQVVDGQLQSGRSTYVPTAESGVFQLVHHDNRYIVFDDHQQHLFIGGGAYERVPWWSSQAALLWVIGLPLLGLVVSAWRLLGIDGWRVVFGQGGLLVFFIGLAATFWFTDVQQLFYGPTAVLLGLLVLPLVALAGFAAQLAGFRRGRNLARSLGIVSGGCLFLWLNYWNLLGYWLG